MNNMSVDLDSAMSYYNKQKPFKKKIKCDVGMMIDHDVPTTQTKKSIGILFTSLRGHQVIQCHTQ